MVFSVLLGLIVFAWILLRQVRVRPIPRALSLRAPVFLGLIGLLTISSYAGSHHVGSAAWAWVVGTMLVGAVGLGLLRGVSVKVWATENWVLRQGTGFTMALWILSLAVHFLGDAAGTHASGGAGLEGSSLLLYLGLTLGVQNAMVQRRAQPLWASLGPAAGRPIGFSFTQAPGAIFTVFRAGGVPPQWGPQQSPASPASPGSFVYGDGDVIDAEVVDEDEDHGPPELPAPR
jgi:hypothetical protein